MTVHTWTSHGPVPKDEMSPEAGTRTRTRGQRLPRSVRRVQLLEAAQAVFVGSGYHAAAMDEIAERAGVSKPVLYQHFPGKLELYLALLDQHRSELEGSVREALARTTGNRQRVHATVAAYFDYVTREGGAFRLLFESDLTNEPRVSRRLDGAAVACADALAEVICADTDLADPDAHLIGMALTGMAQVSARYWLSLGSAMTQAEAARLVGQLAWRGMGGFPLTDRAEQAGRTRG